MTFMTGETAIRLSTLKQRVLQGIEPLFLLKVSVKMFQNVDTLCAALSHGATLTLKTISLQSGLRSRDLFLDAWGKEVGSTDSLSGKTEKAFQRRQWLLYSSQDGRLEKGTWDFFAAQDFRRW